MTRPPATVFGVRLVGVADDGSGEGREHGCQMAIAGFLESYVYGPLGFLTMAPLRYTAKFAIWQPWKGASEGLNRNRGEGEVEEWASSGGRLLFSSLLRDLLTGSVKGAFVAGQVFRSVLIL